MIAFIRWTYMGSFIASSEGYIKKLVMTIHAEETVF